MMKNTLYILEGKITNQLENEIKDEKDSLVLALDIHLKKYLESINIKTLDEDKFLDFNDYEEIDNKALNLSQKWFVGNEFEQILQYNNMNIGFMLQNEFFQNLIKYLHRIKLIQKIIHKINPGKIITIYSKDVMGQIPQSISLSNNIKTKIIQNSLDSKNKSKFEQVHFSINIFKKSIDITISKKQFKYLKKIIEIYWDTKLKLFNNSINQLKQKRKSILLLDFNLIWHESFLKKMNEENYNLLFLNNRRPIIWNNESLNIAKQFPITKVNLPKIEKKIQNEYIQWIIKFKQKIKKIKLNEFFEFCNFDFWEIFKNELEQIIEDRSKNIIILNEKFNEFLDKENIDMVWTQDDWGDDRIIIKTCQQQKIPICCFLSGSMSIYRPEGRLWILPGMTGERIADKLCIWGENDLKNCKDANVNLEKIEIGGAPRYEKLFSKEKKDEDYILILTGGFPSTANSYFLSTSMILNYEKLLKNVLVEVKKFNKKVIIKRHPTQGPNEIIKMQEMFSKNLPDALILKDANTIELISKAKIIISMPSTVVEESIILDKPIILLPYLNNDNGVPYVSSGAVMTIGKSDDIYQIIQKCLYDKQTKEKLKQGRRKFLEKCFSHQNSSSKKHLEIMEKLLNNKK